MSTVNFKESVYFYWAKKFSSRNLIPQKFRTAVAMNRSKLSKSAFT